MKKTYLSKLSRFWLFSVECHMTMLLNLYPLYRGVYVGVWEVSRNYA